MRNHRQNGLVLIVHRAAEEIGGNCIEIGFDGHRLLIDAGSPLDGSSNGNCTVPATLDTSLQVDGVVVSHPHQDHYGLLETLPKTWPVWCGNPTKDLMKLTLALTGRSMPQALFGYTSGIPFKVGPFEVTTYLTDHSAFDAHMILVNAGRTRIFYSGDFRSTGRKAKLVARMLASRPRDVDVLLMEGTTLGRSEKFPTESELERQFVALFQETPGRVFVTWSAQNIDRTVTIYRACKQAGRTLELDLYTVNVLEKLGKYCNRLPQLGWPQVSAVVTRGISRLYERTDRLNNPGFVERCCRSGYAYSASRIQSEIGKKVVMLRPNLLRDYLQKGLVLTKEDLWVFSMWSGYRTKPEYQEVQKQFDDARARTVVVHTSGHSSKEDLMKFSNEINARYLIPIHGNKWEYCANEFRNVRRLRNGEIFQID